MRSTEVLVKHDLKGYFETACQISDFTHPYPLPGGECAHRHEPKFPSWEGVGVGKNIRISLYHSKL